MMSCDRHREVDGIILRWYDLLLRTVGHRHYELKSLEDDVRC